MYSQIRFPIPSVRPQLNFEHCMYKTFPVLNGQYYCNLASFTLSSILLTAFTTNIYFMFLLILELKSQFITFLTLKQKLIPLDDNMWTTVSHSACNVFSYIHIYIEIVASSNTIQNRAFQLFRRLRIHSHIHTRIWFNYTFGRTKICLTVIILFLCQSCTMLQR